MIFNLLSIHIRNRWLLRLQFKNKRIVLWTDRSNHIVFIEFAIRKLFFGYKLIALVICYADKSTLNDFQNIFKSCHLSYLSLPSLPIFPGLDCVKKGFPFIAIAPISDNILYCFNIIISHYNTNINIKCEIVKIRRKLFEIRAFSRNTVFYAKMY